jgi:hypothetical protein
MVEELKEKCTQLLKIHQEKVGIDFNFELNNAICDFNVLLSAENNEVLFLRLQIAYFCLLWSLCKWDSEYPTTGLNYVDEHDQLIEKFVLQQISIKEFYEEIIKKEPQLFTAHYD